MAMILLTNGKRSFVSASRGAYLWQVLTGEIEGDVNDQKVCTHIQNIYLNRHNAPASYIDKHKYLFVDDKAVVIIKQPAKPVVKARVPYKD